MDKTSVPGRETNTCIGCEVGRKKEVGFSGDGSVEREGVTGDGIKGLLGYRLCGTLELFGFYSKHSG